MIQYWAAASTTRVFQADPPGDSKEIEVTVPRGGTCSFQVFIRVPETLTATWIDAAAKTRSNLGVRVRRIGYVPVPNHNTATPPEELDHFGMIPGFVPDPLFPDTRQLAAPELSYGYWITIDAPATTRPGAKTIEVELLTGEPAEPVGTITATVRVSNVVLKPRTDFPVTHWFYTDALCDRYKVELFEEAFWPLCEAYMKNYAAHGSDTIYVPALTPSLDGEKRPTQLLRITPTTSGKYRFDWSLVKRYVELAKACGITRFEWPHLFTQWGVERAILVYHKKGREDIPLWPRTTKATSKVYREFLSQYLPALKRFLDAEGILDVSFHHVSDEPHHDHLENYRKARAMLAKIAPWMKVIDALSNIEFARAGLTDTPIPSISTALEFKREAIPSWAYFCCGPRGRFTNRLLDTPLPKIRAIGWLLYKHRFLGFLHWGYNYWYKSQTREMIDPYTVSDGLKWPGWAHGDTFVVYPGPDGPIDSIRWEVFAESLQEYALLQTLGVDPDDPRLSEMIDFENFPRDPEWIPSVVKGLLA